MDKFEYKVVVYDTKGFLVEMLRPIRLKNSLTSLEMMNGKG